MQTFTVYSSDAMQNATNFLYPHKIEVTDAESFRKAVHRDYVFAEYKGGHRSKENFISSDAVTLDCDNDHSENPTDWLTEELAAEEFTDVAYVIHRSRHNNLQKDSYSPRPRYHIVFPIPEITDATGYANLKKRIQQAIPYFDTNALDAARFFFGTENPEVVFHEGSKTIVDFLDELEEEDAEELFEAYDDEIPEGSRNTR